VEAFVSCNARRPGTHTSYLWVSRARAGRIKSIRGTADTTVTTLLAGARPTLWGQATGIAREMYPAGAGRAPRRGRRWPTGSPSSSPRLRPSRRRPLANDVRRRSGLVYGARTALAHRRLGQLLDGILDRVLDHLPVAR
jgi:hypothetical protein